MKILATALCVLCLSTMTFAQNWPSFRGANASGTAETQSVPTTWNAEKSANLLWKTPLPGLAHSSPIVWGNRVFLTTAISSATDVVFRPVASGNVDPVNEAVKHSWRIYCLDKKSGRVLWQQTAHEGIPRAKRHMKASQANSTPVTDGKYVVALFDSEGMFCYDVNGRLLWKADLGILDPGLHDDPTYQWGHSSSPIIHRNLVIVQCDGHAQSFLAAYDLRTGKQVWKTQRNERPSWSSPVLYQGKGRAELLTNAPRWIRGYDPLTGKELWRFNNNDLIVQSPTPIIAGDLFYFSGGYPGGRPVKAIRAGASGDISLATGQTSNSQVAWQIERGSAYTPTPIVYGDYLYVCSDRGVLTCFNAKTGEQVYQQRLGEQGAGFSASPVAAAGKLYLASEDGDVYVVRAGARYELLAVNPMGEAMMATPAISDGLLIVRGRNHVFAIASNRTVN